jgi:hypothetical protein|tara:strand:- start:26 stop:301 length:276 start_codon:yes stop_codon:yes gene_type:complete
MNEKVPFDKIPFGSRFLIEGIEMVKLGVELCNFDNLCDDQRVRTKVENTTKEYIAVGRIAIVFNSVDINTGAVFSIGDNDLVELKEAAEGV